MRNVPGLCCTPRGSLRRCCLSNRRFQASVRQNHNSFIVDYVTEYYSGPGTSFKTLNLIEFIADLVQVQQFFSGATDEKFSGVEERRKTSTIDTVSVIDDDGQLFQQSTVEGCVSVASQAFRFL